MLKQSKKSSFAPVLAATFTAPRAGGYVYQNSVLPDLGYLAERYAKLGRSRKKVSALAGNENGSYLAVARVDLIVADISEASAVANADDCF